MRKAESLPFAKRHSCLLYVVMWFGAEALYIFVPACRRPGAAPPAPRCVSGSARCPRRSRRPSPLAAARQQQVSIKVLVQRLPHSRRAQRPLQLFPDQASPHPHRRAAEGGESPRKKRGAGCHRRLPPGNLPARFPQILYLP